MVESYAPVLIWENVRRHVCGFSELGNNGLGAAWVWVKCLVDEPMWVWLSAALNHRIGRCPDCSGRQARARHELG